jgi:hypothetical protein
MDPLLDSPWFWIHTSSLLFAYASFALAGVLGLTYVLQFKEIKKKQLGYLYTRLPSLQVLDVMNSRAVAVGWLFMTAGVIVGIIWATPPRAAAGVLVRRSEDLRRRADLGRLLVCRCGAPCNGMARAQGRVGVGGGIHHRPAEFPADQLLRDHQPQLRELTCTSSCLA